MAEFGHARGRIAALAAAVALSPAPETGGSARAQTGDDTAGGSINIGARAGLAADAPVRTAPRQDGAAGPFEFSARAGFASDYIYRGVTLSDRKPAVGAGLEAALGLLYAGATVTSVKLPSQPAAEITMTGGVRPKLGNIDFDFGWTYFLYPGETVPPGVLAGIEYWEAGARADTRIGEALRVAGGFAYSPNVSNTGAWSKYAAFGLGVDLPRNALPQNVTASVTGVLGYYWFGNQSAALGGFPLPAYLNWNAGVTFTRSDLQSRPALLRHQSVEGELLRFYRRSQCHARRKHRPGEKSRRSHLTLVQRHVRREVLVRIAVAVGQSGSDGYVGSWHKADIAEVAAHLSAFGAKRTWPVVWMRSSPQLLTRTGH